MTSFSPEQTSVTAHTLMSTKPRGRAISRTVSSVMSVGTLADFFGHDTQTTPVALSFERQERSALTSSVLREVKMWTMSAFFEKRGERFTCSGRGDTSLRYFSGAFTRWIWEP